jgi:hypothetical protein
MQSQKQLITLIIIAASLCSFLAGYLLTQAPQNNTDILQEQRGVLIDRFNGVDSSSTPTPLPPGLLQATSDAALAPVSASDADAVIYYHSESGSVSKLDLETRTSTLISTASLPRLVQVIWSPDRNRVITVSRASAGLSYAYFDYTTHEHGTLGSNIKDAVFSPDNQKIALVRSGGGDSSIQIVDFNGKNSNTILKTRLNNIKVFWPTADMLAFAALDADTATQSLYTLTTNGDLSQPVEAQDGLSIRWSPSGSAFLYSQRGQDGPELRIFDIASKQSRPLSVRIPAANCAWALDQSSIICAVQTSGETSIVKTLLANNTSTTLFSHLIISPQDVFLSRLGNFLVLVGADQSIWEVKLAQ